MEKKYWKHKTAEIEKGAKIGQGTKVWRNCQILKGAVIGKNCIIGNNCSVWPMAKLGDGVKIESNTDVWDYVVLEDFVFVGPSVVFTNDRNPRAKYPKKQFPQYGKWVSTLVKEGATIGANSTVICGNTIGKWALVGAGTVVTGDVPDYAIVYGTSSEVRGWACECGNKLEFKEEKAVCKICERKYKKEGTKVCIF